MFVLRCYNPSFIIITIDSIQQAGSSHEVIKTNSFVILLTIYQSLRENFTSYLEVKSGSN